MILYPNTLVWITIVPSRSCR